MYEKIYSAIHIGSNLLIVAYNKPEQWQFRVVNKEGEIVQEKFNFTNAKEAEKSGSNWMNNNLQDTE